MKIKMGFSKIYELILDLIKLDKELKEHTDLILDFEYSKFIKPWVYLVISSWIIEKKKMGYDFNFQIENVKNISTLNYASRINFFKLIGYEYNEEFKRHNSKGNFIPLNKINSDNLLIIPTEITRIFINLCNLKIQEKEDKNYNITYMLEYCLTEVIENIDRHSESKSEGLIVVQPYKNSKEIDICIIDSGIGIPNALRKTEKYKLLSDKECVNLSTHENVKTEGLENEGQGNGLYILKELIKSMSGELGIISGRGMYILNSNGENAIDLGCNWNGTIVQFKYKYDQFVSVKSIMGQNYSHILTI